MIISPPFLPSRTAGITDADFVSSGMPVAAVQCPGTTIPEGCFPVSLELGWHGGTHLHAPASGTTTLPVRAIADGEIIFARNPTTPVTDPTHPQNYNPYGEGAAWTDDGMVIMRHTTDIGDGENAEAVVFYSLIMHLSELRGNALKVAKGTASAAQRKAYRKEELGMAGRIYNAADHIHLEIVCDDDNCRKLTGRTTGSVSLSADGRVDAVYGELYFHLPARTNFYAAKPHATVPVPAVAPAHTSDVALVVGLRHASGDGAADHRGDDYLTTYRLDGTVVGNILENHRAEYEMYSRSIEIVDAYPTGSRPTPSAVYELLRFGRVINSANERLVPADCPHWRRVSYPDGQGWVNLNASGVTKYSDADLPNWKSWLLIDDDTDGDSRADSPLLTAFIEDASNADGHLDRGELERRLNMQEVRDLLSRSICKFPSEWNRDTVEDRWGWLQTSPQHQLTGDDWANFRAHVAALAVPAAILPRALRGPHWHFHPLAFVTHFRKCHWLSAGEFRQLVPKHAMRSQGGTFLWETVQTNLTGVASIAVTQRVGLNNAARKYGISSPLRLASFYGNAIQETQWLGTLSEGSGEALWYAPWYGRGFLQLTNPDNFTKYWRYRGRQVPDALSTALIRAHDRIANQPVAQRDNTTLRDQLFPELTQQMCGWREEIRGVRLTGSIDSAHAPADSAGFYWAKNHMAWYADSDHVLQRIPVSTNQGPKVYYRSPSFWQASAAVNLPSRINMIYSALLNGFECRCVAYACSLAVLSEALFPNSNGVSTFEFPEGYIPRRD